MLYGGFGGFYAINPTNNYIYSYDPVHKKWTEVGGPGKMFAVGDKGELYGISSDGNSIFRYSGSPGKWQRIGNQTKKIYAAPGYLYCINKNGDIHKYNGKPFSWTKIGGPGKMFAATAGGDLYGLSPNGNGIYRYLGSPGQWERIGGKAKTIYAQQDNLYALKKDLSLWTYKRSTLPANANMVIITKDSFLSQAVRDYVAYKRLHGISVAVVTLANVLRTSNGVDEAERIRNFLIKAYKGGLLHYVMLLGDVDTIPTKIFFRDNGHKKNNRATQNAYSTDFYYANLHTKDWDLDNDGLWGEIIDDKLDIHSDIVLSRIPFNDAAIVKQVMQQMIDFSRKNGKQWQRRVILAHGFMSKKDDLAGYAEKIDQDILIPGGFTSVKLYVNTTKSNAGKTKSSYFDSNTIPLGNASYIRAIKLNGQGLVLAAAHGSIDSMVSIYEKIDGSQGKFSFGNLHSIRNRPLSGIFFLNGCNTAPTLTHKGYPATNSLDMQLHKQGSRWSSLNKPVYGNIGKEYLKSGAVAVIASTVGSDSGSQDFEYNFTKLLVSNPKTVGDAFMQSKELAGTNRAYRSFYLMGDPTIRLK